MSRWLSASLKRSSKASEMMLESGGMRVLGINERPRLSVSE
jgi:hypothetical protein